MTTVEKIKNLDTDQLKKTSVKLAQRFVINIVIGVAMTVAITLISGAIVSKIQSDDVAE